MSLVSSADGNGNGFDSPEIFELSVTKRILKTLEDFLLRVLCCGYGIGPEDISLPAPRKVEGEFSFSVWKFKMGCHSVARSPGEKSSQRETEKG